jgi:hypothetical protein
MKGGCRGTGCPLRWLRRTAADQAGRLVPRPIARGARLVSELGPNPFDCSLTATSTLTWLPFPVEQYDDQGGCWSRPTCCCIRPSPASPADWSMSGAPATRARAGTAVVGDLTGELRAWLPTPGLARRRPGQVAQAIVGCWPDGEVTRLQVDDLRVGQASSLIRLAMTSVRSQSTVADMGHAAGEFINVGSVGECCIAPPSGPPYERDAPWQPNPAARPHLRFPATSIPPRCPISCTCRPRPCPAGPPKASYRS